MTDILDLPDWNVLTSRLDDGTYTIEAEYAQPLQACTKCGVVGKLTGMSEKVSIEMGQIKSVKLCKD